MSHFTKDEIKNTLLWANKVQEIILSDPRTRASYLKLSRQERFERCVQVAGDFLKARGVPNPYRELGA